VPAPAASGCWPGPSRLAPATRCPFRRKGGLGVRQLLLRLEHRPLGGDGLLGTGHRVLGGLRQVGDGILDVAHRGCRLSQYVAVPVDRLDLGRARVARRGRLFGEVGRGVGQCFSFAATLASATSAAEPPSPSQAARPETMTTAAKDCRRPSVRSALPCGDAGHHGLRGDGHDHTPMWTSGSVKFPHRSSPAITQ
jgi:hypothetical protein